MNQDVLDYIRDNLPEPPARVIEVGAGEGELAAALRGLGYDVLAIDPRAASAPGVVRLALHEVDEPPASFDAAVAVLSLHHVNPLPESCERLAELLRPGGRLVVDEFDTECLDERAARWWWRHQADVHGAHPHDPLELVADMRGHLHSVASLRDQLGRRLSLGDVTRGAYLHRWDLPDGLRDEEERLIAAGSIPATGARFIGIKT
jgi:SAM-dependent methyltransferase